jgi:hypothetical protein
MERFQAYLGAMTNEARNDVRFPPLVSINPMAKDHVTARLDELLTLQADTIATNAIAEAVAQLGTIEGDFKHGMIVMDDVHGGWTNRTTNDLAFRFGVKLPTKRLWITTVLWVSELPSSATIRQAVRISIFRLHYLQTHDIAQSLGQIMTQEGAAAAFAGLQPCFDDEELDYSRQVLEP